MLLPPHGEGSSYSSPAPVGGSLPWDPMNLSKVIPSQGQHFFSNFSSVSLPQASVLRKQAGGHKSCPQTCSSMGFSWAHSLLQASTCSISILVVDLSIPVPSLCSGLCCPGGCRGISVPVPGAPPAPPALTWLSAGLFLSHISLLSLAAAAQGFFPSLLYLIPVTDGPAAGLSRSCLALALSDMRAAPGSFSQQPPL